MSLTPRGGPPRSDDDLGGMPHIDLPERSPLRAENAELRTKVTELETALHAAGEAMIWKDARIRELTAIVSDLRNRALPAMLARIDVALRSVKP